MSKEIKLAAVVRRIKKLTKPLPPISRKKYCEDAAEASHTVAKKETVKPAMGKVKRSLYTCSYALVSGDMIKCRAGHCLNARSKTGPDILRLLRGGEPLELTVCQNCPDYDELGPPVPEGERGWIEGQYETANGQANQTLREERVTNTTEARNLIYHLRGMRLK